MMPALIIMIAFAILTPSLGLAATGDLDSTFGRFGSNGKVEVASMDTREMARLPNGKILAIGDSGGSIVIRRFRVNGDIDYAFGNNGLVSIDLGSDRACPNYTYSCGIAIQQDGKFVVVAESRLVSKRDFAILRFHQNGDLDSTFGVGGVVQVNFGGHDDSPNDVAIQADGKIVVVGKVDVDWLLGTATGFGTIRLNTNGSLDTSFHNDGKAYVSFDSAVGLHNRHYATAVDIQSDGKIVVVGMATDYGVIRANDHTDFGFVRYNTDGTRDNTFSGDGKKRVGFGGDDKALNVAIKPDGKIVAVGWGESFKEMAIAQLDSNGNTDDTFSGDGRVSIDVSSQGDELLIGLDIQPDGKIVATGKLESTVVMVRIATSGLLDGTWSASGIAWMGEQGIGRSVIIRPDGNFHVMYDHAILLVNPDQTGDKPGTVVTDFGNAEDRAWGLTMQKDGKPIVIGDTKTAGLANTKIGVSRYLDNGSLDTSFGLHGMQRLGPLGDAYGRSTAVLKNGKILVAGFSRANPTADLRCALFRLNPNGSNDDEFSLTGIHTSIGNEDDICVKVLVQEDDKIILVGYAATPTSGDPNRWGIALLRFHSNGQLDTSFNGTGKVITNLGTGSTTRSRNALLQTDGKILVSGTHDGDMLVMRYNTNGTLDSSFGTGGIVLADHGGVAESLVAGEPQTAASAGSLIDIAYGLGFIYQGHIAVGGLVDGVDFGILFLTPDGARCTVCGLVAGNHYFRTVDFGYTEAAYGFAVQDNGAMVLTGGESSGNSGVLGARFKRKRTIEGAGYKIDTAFSGDGKVQHTSRFRSSARTNALYGSGIFIAGFRFNGQDDDFFLMKLENDSETWPGGVKFENLIFGDGFEN